jgi:hypothetical protein
VNKETQDAVAERIRAELVCCDIYAIIRRDAFRIDKSMEPVDPTQEAPSDPTDFGMQGAMARAILRRDWHDLCYWGEAAARLAEGRCPGYETGRTSVSASARAASRTAQHIRKGADEVIHEDITIRSVQAAVWSNKLAKGFNTDDIPLEFCLLTAEIGEAFTAWRQGLGDFGEELADITLFLVGVAEMTGVDLAAEVRRKLSINASRKYRPGPNGVLLKEEEGGGGE